MNGMEILGLLIVLSHFAVIGSILLWFGLGKPTSAAQLRAEFKKQLLGLGTNSR